jgi:hypothetical protein
MSNTQITKGIKSNQQNPAAGCKNTVLIHLTKERQKTMSNTQIIKGIKSNRLFVAAGCKS